MEQFVELSNQNAPMSVEVLIKLQREANTEADRLEATGEMVIRPQVYSLSCHAIEDEAT